MIWPRRRGLTASASPARSQEVGPRRIPVRIAPAQLGVARLAPRVGDLALGLRFVFEARRDEGAQLVGRRIAAAQQDERAVELGREASAWPLRDERLEILLDRAEVALPQPREPEIEPRQVELRLAGDREPERVDRFVEAARAVFRDAEPHQGLGTLGILREDLLEARGRVDVSSLAQRLAAFAVRRRASAQCERGKREGEHRSTAHLRHLTFDYRHCGAYNSRREGAAVDKYEYWTGLPEVGIVPRAPHAGPLLRHVYEQEHGRGGFSGKVSHTYHLYPPTNWLPGEGRHLPDWAPVWESPLRPIGGLHHVLGLAPAEPARDVYRGMARIVANATAAMNVTAPRAPM